YLQPHVGGDIPLLRLLLRRLIERGAVDDAFLDTHAVGWPAVRDDLLADDPDELLARCGVAPDAVAAATAMLADARAGIFAWAMGITQHAHGVDNVQALANLALARGWIGRRGAGLLPIRGHSNVQGVGSMGVTPGLKAEFAERLGALYGIRVPEAPGTHTLASVQAAAPGQI